ncbi:MAG: hypothetical protein QF893_13650 [Alphaproteobacteria bacterium]|jgi:hypothetical protein|nr:hypothetical protein [Alphaproteobacteria bacterium]
MSEALTLETVLAALTEAGLASRGAFRPGPDDGVPDLAPGRPAGTLILAGGAGPGMWRAFAAAREPERDLLDDWSGEILSALAERFDAIAHFPSAKPYMPFQRWARRAEPVFASPLGIHIHADHGLWHSYRGALSFAEALALPEAEARANPCESCPDKPCLTTCPVDAFSEHGYDIPACVRHLVTDDGQDCMQLACRARRACPVGRDNRYEPAQASFHMRHFLKTRRHLAAAE